MVAAKKEHSKDEEEKIIDKKKDDEENCSTKKVDDEDSTEKGKEDEEVEKTEDDDEDDEDEEGKKKKKNKAKKGSEGGKNPEESEAQGATSGSTSPNQGVPSTQNVFIPQSAVSVSREQVTPMSKSTDVDLSKSPLFVNISKQMDGLQTALTHKVDALEKSVNDRLKNIKSDMEKIEKFYGQSFHKALGENVSPEATQQLGISKQIADGKVRFSLR